MALAFYLCGSGQLRVEAITVGFGLVDFNGMDDLVQSADGRLEGASPERHLPILIIGPQCQACMGDSRGGKKPAQPQFQRAARLASAVSAAA